MSDSPIRPDDYVIVRKRKKYKFAKFSMSPLCFEFDEWKLQHIDTIEVGAGDGIFSVELATRYPEQVFMAVDVKADRLQKGAYLAQQRKLTNVYFARVRADQLAEIVAEQSVQTLWLTFPDPFPKRGSAGRRLTHPTYLSIYSKLLKTSGTLHLKHDNRDFYQWSLERLVSNNWHLTELSFDLHDSNLHEDYKIMTTYETRWLNDGLKIHYVSAYYPDLEGRS